MPHNRHPCRGGNRPDPRLMIVRREPLIPNRYITTETVLLGGMALILFGYMVRGNRL